MAIVRRVLLPTSQTGRLVKDCLGSPCLVNAVKGLFHAKHSIIVAFGA